MDVSIVIVSYNGREHLQRCLTSIFRQTEDVSFEVQAGQRVGVVGRSGAGKSTLMWLLQRLYDPDSGRVLLGGRDSAGGSLLGRERPPGGCPG